MLRIVLFISVFVLLTGNSKAEIQFKVGQEYRDVINLKIVNISKQQIALPPGKWIVTAIAGIDARRSVSGTQVASGTKLATIYLANIVDGKLKSAIRFRYAHVNFSTGWSVPKFCRRDNLNYDEVKEAYNGTQTDCWGVSFVRGAGRPGTAGARSVEYIQEMGAKIPAILVYSQYYRADMENYLSVGYVFNPEFEGISPSENLGSMRLVDYYPNRISQYPEKKAYIDKLVKWGKDWKKYVDLGFEGKLTTEIMSKANGQGR